MHRVSTHSSCGRYHPTRPGHRRDEDLSATRELQARRGGGAIAERTGDDRDRCGFHLAITEAGRNPYFTGLLKRLLDEGRRILRLYYKSYDGRLLARFVEERDEIIAAIEARDFKRAERLGREHAKQIVQQVQKLLTQYHGLDAENLTREILVDALPIN